MNDFHWDFDWAPLQKTFAFKRLSEHAEHQARLAVLTQVREKLPCSFEDLCRHLTVFVGGPIEAYEKIVLGFIRSGLLQETNHQLEATNELDRHAEEVLNFVSDNLRFIQPDIQRQLEHQLKEVIQSESKKIVLWGHWNLAHQAARVLKQNGKTVVCFVSENHQETSFVEGVPVISVDDYLNSSVSHDAVLITHRKFTDRVVSILGPKTKFYSLFLQKPYVSGWASDFCAAETPAFFAVGANYHGCTLLARLLSLCPGLRYTGGQFYPPDQPVVTAEEIMTRLDQFQPGEFSSVHFCYDKGLADFFAKKKTKVLLSVRDPRDVWVSQFLGRTYLFKPPFVNTFYAQELRSDDDRLTCLLTGEKPHGYKPQQKADNVVEQDWAFIPKNTKTLVEFIEAYLGWLDYEHSFAVRTEKLSFDPANPDLQKQTLIEILSFLNLSLPESDLNRVLMNWPYDTNLSLRKSSAGSWKHFLSDKQKKQFKDTAGDLLIKLGYEKNHDW